MIERILTLGVVALCAAGGLGLGHLLGHPNRPMWILGGVAVGWGLATLVERHQMNALVRDLRALSPEKQEFVLSTDPELAAEVRERLRKANAGSAEAGDGGA